LSTSRYTLKLSASGTVTHDISTSAALRIARRVLPTSVGATVTPQPHPTLC